MASSANLPYNDEDLSEGETLNHYSKYSDQQHSTDMGGYDGRARGRGWDRDRPSKRYHGSRSRSGRPRDWDAPTSGGRVRSRSRSANASRSRSRSGSGPHPDPGSASHARRRRRNYSANRRSQSPQRSSGPGYVNNTIIVEGLPAGVPSSELRTALLQSPCLADYADLEIRIPSPRGPCRAFVQFASINDASDFVRANFPRFVLDLPGPDDAPDGRLAVYIHYARRTDDSDGRPAPCAANWSCPQCDFSNYSTRTKCKECATPQSAATQTAAVAAAAAAASGRLQLTGESDAVVDPGVPTQVLVVYPVPPGVDEDRLAADLGWLEMQPKTRTADHEPREGWLRSTAPSSNTAGLGGRPGSLHRVFLMRDRMSGHALGYAFAEFWSIHDAAAALAKHLKAPSALVVGPAAVTVAATHTGVFVPADPPPTPDAERFSFHPLFNPALRVRYWEPTVYPSPRVLSAQSPDAAAASSLSNSNTNNINTNTNNINTTTSTTTSTTTASTTTASTTTASSPAADDAKKSKKRKADGTLSAPSAAKKPAPMLNQMAVWQKKSAELRAGAGPQQPAADDHGTAVPAPTTHRAPIKISLSTSAKLGASSSSSSSSSSPSSSAPPPPPPATSGSPPVSYIDKDRLCCLLCMMKYKSLDDCAQHERSRNHKSVLDDHAKVEAAHARLVKRGLLAVAPAPAPAPAPIYRDRAKERRQVFSQPSRPAIINQSPAPQTETATAAAAPPPKPSKGASMLAKMGWTAGKGLGLHGDGRTATIQTNAYQEGVGLGADGGNLGDASALAETRTKASYDQYVATVQSRARERYARLDQAE